MVSKLEVVRGKLLRDMYHDNVTPACGEAILELVDTYDENKLRPTKPNGESYKATSTLTTWFDQLYLFARHRDLTTTSIDHLLRDLQAMKDGTHPATTVDGGISNATLASYQSTLRSFYRFHDFDIEKDEIPIAKTSRTPVDENDILTEEEIHQARDACENLRNLMIFDLLVYTGCRKFAIVTLRIKDIDLENATYRYNTEHGGLKGAEKRQGPRPLLGALSSVRDWINKEHPNPEPDSYLITQLPSYKQTDGKEHVHPNMIGQVMSKIKKNSGIDKPMNPHNLRHTFVTMLARDYDDSQISSDAIKYYIGHSTGSNVMETTYQHISGEEYADEGKVAFGQKEPEESSPLTPPTCYTCDEPLQDDWQVCPNCYHEYGPNARNAKEQLEDATVEHARNVKTDQQDDDFDVLLDYVRENKAAIINRMTESE